jgi:hypothetical protein
VKLSGLIVLSLVLHIITSKFLFSAYSSSSLQDGFEKMDPMQSGYALCIMEYLEYNLHTQKGITNAINSIVSICRLKESSELYAICKQIYDDVLANKPVNDDWGKKQIHKLFDVTHISMQVAFDSYKKAKKIEQQEEEAENGKLDCSEDLIVKTVMNMINCAIEKHQMKIRSKIHGSFTEGYTDQIFVFVTKKKKVWVSIFGRIIDEARVAPTQFYCDYVPLAPMEYIFLLFLLLAMNFGIVD